MKFTTHLELQSQATRLVEPLIVYARNLWIKDGILTLYDALSQRTYTQVTSRLNVFRLQFGHPALSADFHFELFPLHSPLLGESLLVSFPPLINMLKFGGSSYLIWDQKKKIIWKF